MYEKRWELTWVLELDPEWEVKVGSECGRLHAVTEEGMDVGSPVRVG